MFSNNKYNPGMCTITISVDRFFRFKIMATLYWVSSISELSQSVQLCMQEVKAFSS